MSSQTNSWRTTKSFVSRLNHGLSMWLCSIHTRCQGSSEVSECVLNSPAGVGNISMQRTGVWCRRWATCRAPCRARIEAPALEPIPFLHFLKGSLICCCLTFNGKSLPLLRDGSTQGKGGCREASRVHHIGMLLLASC